MRVWNASTGVALQQLNGHSDWVISVSFSHDGMRIVSGSYDKSVRVWGASTNAGSQHIVSGSEITSIWVWDEMCLGVLWTSMIDGWIVSLPIQERLMWIPQGIREVIHHPYNILIISQNGYAHVDFQDCNIGTKWMECYNPMLV